MKIWRGQPKQEPTPAFAWKRGECLALATQACTHCFGLGQVVQARSIRAAKGSASTGGPETERKDVCKCVLRAIFRACLARFRQCASKEKYMSRVSLEANPGRVRKGGWGLKNEEFIADFCLLAERALGAGSLGMKIFKYHFLLGADWKLCCRKLKMDRGNFFHEVYRVEEALGRAYRETQPYALFPLDEYFGFRATGVSVRRPANANGRSGQPATNDDRSMAAA